MKLKTIIIDADPNALDKLKSYIQTVPFLELTAACAGTSEALEVLAQQKIDVIFTDIELPDIDGITFIESLTERPMVVFTTAHRDYAVEGFRLSAIDYLVKPYSLAQFQRAANKLLEVYRSRHRDDRAAINSLFVKVETRFERIDLADVLYIKGYGEYLQIFVYGRQHPVLTLSSFSDIMRRLGPSFLQVHRSYIANMDRIERIEKSRIVIGENTYIPISATYRDEFINYLHTRSIGKLPK